jgi:hypothetical protein
MKLLISRMIVRTSISVTLAVLCLFATPAARAEMIMLSQTTLITGSDSSVATITVPSSGSLTVDLSNIPWPESLASLSFMLSSASQVVGTFSTDSSMVQSYEVTPGTYFAHLTGTAGGSLDLGIYSITVGFQPAGVVPLPPSGSLLIIGLLAVLGLAWPIGKTNPTTPQVDHADHTRGK